MKDEKQRKELEKELIDIEIPDELLMRMELARDRAVKERKDMKFEKNIVKKNHKLKYSAIAAAAAVVVFAGSVNISPAFAESMKEVPVLGSIVKVITIDKISEHDQYLEADINIAGIKGNDKANEILREEADKAFAQAKDKAEFVKNAVEKTGTTEYIPANVTQNYEVLSCKDGILSVKITTLEIQASGYETLKGINIDLVNNKVIELKDQFKENANYVEIISNNIKKQMKDQMMKDENKMYFIGKDETMPFEKIKKDQTYFIDTNGNLVIAFDEYEVAPGFMGPVEFTIPNEVIKDIKK